MARLLGPAKGEPLFYRRLLTEALKLTAPNAWARLHAAGPAALDAWFAASDPLDADLVEEAQRLHGPSPSATEPSLSTATRLVQPYQLVAHCRDTSPSATCVRARQLQQLLVSTGPLLMRRRVEDIWSTDCGKVSPDLRLTWVQDFTTPHVAAHTSDYGEVTDAGQAKLFSCFLRDTTAELSFSAWLEARLPATIESDVLLAICTQYARLLWEGQAAVIPGSFSAVPTADEVPEVATDVPEPPLARLRQACQDRHGTGASFLEDVKTLASIAHGFGEPPDGVPWRVDPGSGDPVEAARFTEAATPRSWARHVVSGETIFA